MKNYWVHISVVGSYSVKVKAESEEIAANKGIEFLESDQSLSVAGEFFLEADEIDTNEDDQDSDIEDIEDK